MQMITSRANKINDVIISYTADDILQLYQRAAVVEKNVWYMRAKALQIERDEIWELHCKAKIHLLDQLNPLWPTILYQLSITLSFVIDHTISEEN